MTFTQVDFFGVCQEVAFATVAPPLGCIEGLGPDVIIYMESRIVKRGFDGPIGIACLQIFKRQLFRLQL